MLTAKYTTPIQIVHTAYLKRRVRTIADREGLSLAEVLRQIIDAGIDTRERQSQAFVAPEA